MKDSRTDRDTVPCLVCDGIGKLLYPPKIIHTKDPDQPTISHALGGTFPCEWCDGTGRMKYHPIPIKWAEEKKQKDIEERERAYYR